MAPLPPLPPIPQLGRVFTGRRCIRLADMDAHGRLRLDAVARFLQDIAIDDVEETGWGMPDHLWFVRSIRVEVPAPFLSDREVALSTWCSGAAAIAAGRRWSLHGDGGGRIEVDSVWIHLGPDATPARLEGFGVYEQATAGRRVSTKLWLPDPPPGAHGAAWSLRATDVDLHGHVNNAVHWAALEERLAAGGPDLTLPYVALLDYRAPLDLADPVELVSAGDDVRLDLWLTVAGACRAAARVESLPPGAAA